MKIYENYLKRVMDFILSLIAIIIFSPLLVILSLIGLIAMKGNPFFSQSRPGKIDKKTGNEKIFKLIKFRTMSNEKDKDGNLLPDNVRLNSYGKFLRSTSLDELPSLINILNGDLSIVGPRPQLVRDMVFMNPVQRRGHQGLLHERRLRFAARARQIYRQHHRRPPATAGRRTHARQGRGGRGDRTFDGGDPDDGFLADVRSRRIGGARAR